MVKESPLRKYNNCYNLIIFKLSDIEMFQMLDRKKSTVLHYTTTYK